MFARDYLVLKYYLSLFVDIVAIRVTLFKQGTESKGGRSMA
jgi:hypothetical protein